MDADCNEDDCSDVQWVRYIDRQTNHVCALLMNWSHIVFMLRRKLQYIHVVSNSIRYVYVAEFSKSEWILVL